MTAHVDEDRDDTEKVVEATTTITMAVADVEDDAPQPQKKDLVYVEKKSNNLCLIGSDVGCPIETTACEIDSENGNPHAAALGKGGAAFVESVLLATRETLAPVAESAARYVSDTRNGDNDSNCGGGVREGFEVLLKDFERRLDGICGSGREDVQEKAKEVANDAVRFVEVQINHVCGENFVELTTAATPTTAVKKTTTTTSEEGEAKNVAEQGSVNEDIVASQSAPVLLVTVSSHTSKRNDNGEDEFVVKEPHGEEQEEESTKEHAGEEQESTKEQVIIDLVSDEEEEEEEEDEEEEDEQEGEEEEEDEQEGDEEDEEEEEEGELKQLDTFTTDYAVAPPKVREAASRDNNRPSPEEEEETYKSVDTSSKRSTASPDPPGATTRSKAEDIEANDDDDAFNAVPEEKSGHLVIAVDEEEEEEEEPKEDDAKNSVVAQATVVKTLTNEGPESAEEERASQDEACCLNGAFGTVSDAAQAKETEEPAACFLQETIVDILSFENGKTQSEAIGGSKDEEGTVYKEEQDCEDVPAVTREPMEDLSGFNGSKAPVMEEALHVHSAEPKESEVTEKTEFTTNLENSDEIVRLEDEPKEEPMADDVETEEHDVSSTSNKKEETRSKLLAHAEKKMADRYLKEPETEGRDDYDTAADEAQRDDDAVVADEVQEEGAPSASPSPSQQPSTSRPPHSKKKKKRSQRRNVHVLLAYSGQRRVTPHHPSSATI